MRSSNRRGVKIKWGESVHGSIGRFRMGVAKIESQACTCENEMGRREERVSKGVAP